MAISFVKPYIYRYDLAINFSVRNYFNLNSILNVKAQTDKDKSSTVFLRCKCLEIDFKATQDDDKEWK